MHVLYDSLKGTVCSIYHIYQRNDNNHFKFRNFELKSLNFEFELIIDLRQISIGWAVPPHPTSLSNSGDSPWNRPPTEITPRGQLYLIQGVKKARTTTSRDLQASLASVKISVHASTIRERETGQKWPLWESSKAKTTADKQNIKARICHKTSLWSPETFGNVFW